MYVSINNLKITECDMGNFGQNCSETCSIHCQEPEQCYHVDGSCMCQPGWKGKDCKQGNIKVCQETEKCDHVDGSCMCQPGWKGKDCKQGNVKVCQENQRSLIMSMVLVSVSLDGRVTIVNNVMFKPVRNQRSVII